MRLRHAGFTVESALTPEEAWGSDGPWATVDPEAIKQALLNLVSNAEKYSPDSKWIQVGLRPDGKEAVLTVSDRGVGIRPRDAARIFDEFYRADDSLTANVRGTGLGLTLTRRIVEDHGGRITYAPNPGGGSVFEIRLPLSAPPPLESSLQASASRESSSSTSTSHMPSSHSSPPHDTPSHPETES
ncbi:MAG: ATP-binding protein [Candidatus Eisenbacteria bacterium]